MIRTTALSFLAAFSIVLGACSAESPKAPPAEDGSPTTEVTSANVALRTLAESEAGGVKVRFTAQDTKDGTLLGIEETGSAYSKGSPVEDLIQQKLTMLEVYRAIAPTGQAPAELIAAHPMQAKSLGRQDDAVKVVDFNPNAAVEKSIAGCEAWVFADPAPNRRWGLRRSINSTGGNNWLPVSNASNTDWWYTTEETVSLGVCNDSATTATTAYAWDNSKDGWGWSYSATTNVAPHSYVRHWLRMVTYGQCSIQSGGCVGDCLWPNSGYCIPRSYGTRWGVMGTGSLYHLKTAEAYTVLY